MMLYFIQPDILLFAISFSIVVLVSYHILGAVIQYYDNRRIQREYATNKYLYQPALDISDLEDDTPLGECSLATINFLFAQDRTLFLEGHLNLGTVILPVNGVYTTDGWILLLQSLSEVPVAEVLLEDISFLHPEYESLT